MVNPKKRITAAACLNHEWIQKNNKTNFNEQDQEKV